jgi:hypothetical protein
MRWTWFRIRIVAFAGALVVGVIVQAVRGGAEPRRAPDPARVEAEQLVARVEAQCEELPALVRELVKLRSELAALARDETRLARGVDGSTKMTDAANAVDDAAAHLVAIDTACLDGVSAHPIDVASCNRADAALDALVAARRALIAGVTADANELRSIDATLEDTITSLGRDELAADLVKIDGCP